MNNYIDFKARHVAALILIEARKGIRPPVMRNVKKERYIADAYSPAVEYYKVVEE